MRKCTACDGPTARVENSATLAQVAVCQDCGGLDVRGTFRGIDPISDLRRIAEPPEGTALRYFDAVVLDGRPGGASRVHGWYDPDTGIPAQFG